MIRSCDEKSTLKSQIFFGAEKSSKWDCQFIVPGLLIQSDMKSKVRQYLGCLLLIFVPHWHMNQLNKNPNIA